MRELVEAKYSTLTGLRPCLDTGGGVGKDVRGHPNPAKMEGGVAGPKEKIGE